MCDSAGIMYWGDTGHARIETAYLNGTGRRFLLRETAALYYALVHDAGNIYFTDWRYVYVCKFSPATNMTAEWHHSFTCLPPDNVICKLPSRLDSRWLVSVCIIFNVTSYTSGAVWARRPPYAKPSHFYTVFFLFCMTSYTCVPVLLHLAST